MPHILLRHSDNLPNCNFAPFLNNLHALLAENLGVKLTSCSSMIIPHSQYLIGDGDINNAFVHLEIKVKSNIDKEALDLTATIALKLLKNYMINYNNLSIKTSVDCVQVSQYFKS